MKPIGRLTTHVLDLTSGTPARGLKLELWRLDGAAAERLKAVVTNDDGRVEGALLEGEAFAAGTYELRFMAGDYRRRTGGAVSRTAVPRCRAGALRRGGSTKPLPRPTAAFRLWLFHLSRKLTHDALVGSVSPPRRGRLALRCGRERDPPRLSCGCAAMPAAPRRAAPRATAAPALWRSAPCAAAGWNTRRSTAASAFWA